MATRKIEVEQTGRRVAANVRALRKARGNMTLDDLSRRLSELDRPIPKSGLSKIESGERRVDVDDLMALAIALQVTPNRLLLTDGIKDEQIGLTKGFSTTDRAAWQWSCADRVHQTLLGLPQPGQVEGFRNPAGRFEGDGEPVTIYEFQRENRPHRPPVMLTPSEWRKAAPFEERMSELRREASAAGVNFRALVDDTVFEQHDDADQYHTNDHHNEV